MKANCKKTPLFSMFGENPETACGSAEVLDAIHGKGFFCGVQEIDGPLSYGKIHFLDGSIFIGDFEEDSSNLSLGTLIHEDGERIASGIFDGGDLLNGTITFSDGRIFYAKDRFDEDGTYDGAMFEADGTWSQGVYDAKTMKLIDGWKINADGKVERIE